MDMTQEIKTGDSVIKTYRGVPTAKMTIVRTTKTQAITEKGDKFKIEAYNGIAKFIGNEYGMYTYYLSTPEWEAKFESAKLRKTVKEQLSSLDFDNLTDQQLKSILEIIS